MNDIAVSADPLSTFETGLNQRHLPILDGLRAVAVFSVILFHAGLPAPGGLGVLMFFVISGFLITWLLLRENATYGEISLKNFYFRRFLRIFPAFYVYAALLIFLSLIFRKHIVWAQAIAALIYVNNYYQALYGDPNTAFSHTWSLGIEEQFYLTWPALFVILRRTKQTLVRLVTALILVAWVYRAALQFLFHVHQGWFYEAFDARFDHLLVGCLLALILFDSVRNARLARYCSRGDVLLATLAVLILSVLLEFRYGSGYRDSVAFIVDPLLIAVIIPMLIAQRHKAAVRWLETSPIRYIGRISYSLYLYQQLVIEPAMKFFRWTPLSMRVALACGAVVAVASLSYFGIEQPFQKLKIRNRRAISSKVGVD
jgi:peptidoglycan/LPS O-acetylase OafA/YrhL